MTPEQQAAAVRRAVGLFRLTHRSVIAVRGGDRVRWLGGMVSGDVANLDGTSQRSGCAALLLTEKGRIVADLRSSDLRTFVYEERSFLEADEHLKHFPLLAAFLATEFEDAARHGPLRVLTR